MLSTLGGCLMAAYLIFHHGWKQLTFGNDESICPNLGERSYCTACIGLWVLEASLLLGEITSSSEVLKLWTLEVNSEHDRPGFNSNSFRNF